VPVGTELHGDLCIVGAGAAGITLALELAGTGASILLIESGGISTSAKVQSLYRGEVVDPLTHSALHHYRVRRLGGSTTIWGGRCVPFDPIDFAPRPYVPGSGWPIDRADLVPYYIRANAYCEAGAFAYSVPEALPGRPRELIPGLRGRIVRTDSIERFSRPTDFGTRYRAALATAPNLRLLLHANCVQIALDPAGRVVDHLVIATFRPSRLTVRAHQVVLAAGGLETTRLLLASNDVMRDGIGNHSDMLGRNYMCHLAGTIGTLELFGAPQAVAVEYERSRDGIYCRRRLTVSEAAQRRLKLLNAVFRLDHPSPWDPGHGHPVLSAMYLVKEFILYEYSRKMRLHRTTPGDLLRHARNIAAHPIALSSFAAMWLRRRTLARRKLPSVVLRSPHNVYCLEFNSEQVPNPASRLTLAQSKDALGMPQLRVDWRCTALDVDSVRRGYLLLQRAFARARVGRLHLDADRLDCAVLAEGAQGGHHLGTTRMSYDPADGVVDPHCRVHGVENLYIAGGSVFVTSSHANPCLTIVALAIRLADHLRTLPLARTAAGRPAARAPAEPAALVAAPAERCAGLAAACAAQAILQGSTG
jgi:choline dehydrogenase-like flavoprotein